MMNQILAILVMYGFAFWVQDPARPATAPAAPHRPAPADDTPAYTLAAGTPVKLSFAQRLDARRARPGDAVEFVLAESIRADGVTVVRRGARTIGRVVRAQKAGAGGQGGSLAVELEYLRAGKDRVPLRGLSRKDGKAAAGKTVLLTALFGLSGLLLSTGHQAVIPEGTELMVEIAETTRVHVPPCGQGVC
jgi:hypothetical protein